MKKYIFLIIVVLLSCFSYSQEDRNTLSKQKKFSFNDKGLYPKNLTVSVKGVKAKDMLAKTKEWVEKKYGNTKDNIEEENSNDQDKKKGKKMRFKGFSDNAICFSEADNYRCEGLHYVIELHFKDGEYKFKPKKLTYKPSSSRRKVKINFEKSDFHQTNGSVKNDYKKVPEQIETLFNNLNRSLLNYLTDKPQEDER